MYAAAAEGHTTVVSMLLRRGMEANIDPGDPFVVQTAERGRDRWNLSARMLIQQLLCRFLRPGTQIAS